MRELLRSDDPALLGLAEARLTQALIRYAVLDGYSADLHFGQSRRLVVHPADYARAQQLLAEEGILDDKKDSA